ncbi:MULTISPECIES: ATP-binding protein [Sphingobacterium]|uniref:sensor histidine kinase n=1 Tax=Sphingobacterium TaxID=28453 RepID=UPI0010451477|nr:MULTISPECIES: ATP-binding protein [Sphingobacterium]MCW2259234.1 two-component system phosphate regulon sensor histidine kinase PhoR [Sphingobacterium kitahiroshimense]TCR14317.1 two-component system phosphate regulon sensor histidine kinase PhoR [Sphingobacterium sp. JUb78]
MNSKTEQLKELSQLNDELENYFRNTIIPQLFVDADLLLRKFTPPAMKHFVLKEEFIGMPIADIQDNFKYPNIINNIHSVIATGKMLEKEIQTTDLRWYQMNILPYITFREGKTNGVIITFVDITARIRDLKEHEKLILEHELLLDQLAHDIKSPLAGLMLTCEYFKVLPEKKSTKFLKMLANLECGLSNIKRVLSDFTESHWGKQKYQSATELVDLPHILDDVMLALAPQILEFNAKIVHRFEITEINFVRRKLRSVLYNLLSNAIKYTPVDRKPEIAIYTFEEDGFMVISVTDNGIGMCNEDLLTVFEKFKRICASVEGTGVGLYLVNTIVKNAGGKITITSTPGVGSEFKVYLKLDSTQ